MTRHGVSFEMQPDGYIATFRTPDVLDAGPYMDQAKAIRAAERLHAIVGTWHRENHAGPYLRCHQQPCRDLNRQEQV